MGKDERVSAGTVSIIHRMHRDGVMIDFLSHFLFSWARGSRNS